MKDRELRLTTCVLSDPPYVPGYTLNVEVVPVEVCTLLIPERNGIDWTSLAKKKIQNYTILVIWKSIKGLPVIIFSIYLFVVVLLCFGGISMVEGRGGECWKSWPFWFNMWLGTPQ